MGRPVCLEHSAGVHSLVSGSAPSLRDHRRVEEERVVHLHDNEAYCFFSMPHESGPVLLTQYVATVR